jgi:hypothetical protein
MKRPALAGGGAGKVMMRLRNRIALAVSVALVTDTAILAILTPYGTGGWIMGCGLAAANGLCVGDIVVGGTL